MMKWQGMVWALGVSVAMTACSPGEGQDESVVERDPLEEGAVRARVCMGCHGKQGISRVASYPSIAGLEQDYLAAQLRAYRSGERQNPMMNAMATNLSDEDIELLALYFAAQQPNPESR